MKGWQRRSKFATLIKEQRTKTNINLRKLLHVRKKVFFIRKREQRTKKS